MTNVAKYNTCKAVSSVLTVGTPIVTLIATGESFVSKPSASVSAAGIIAILISALFFKDKLAENFKAPSAFIVSACVFGLILLVENLLMPMKIVCIASMISSGIDEVSFKRMYKEAEALMPKKADAYKHLGYFITTQQKVEDIEKA